MNETRASLSSRNCAGKKILFLGGEGFVGRNLVSHFSRRNECFSVGEKESVFSKKRNDVFLKKNPYAEKIPGEYDSIVHLIDHKVSEDDFSMNEKTLFQNISLSDGGCVIVFSSAVVYANPDSNYGRRKLMLEKISSEYCGKRGIPLTILRLFNTFGSFQIPYRQGSLVANLLYNFLAGKSTDINDMEAKRDLLYSGDIAKFVEYVMVNEMRGTFDAGSGALLSIRELISLLERDIVRKGLKSADKGNTESVAPRFAEGDLVKSVRLRDMREGLWETFEFYRKNKATLRRILGEENT